MTTRSRTRTWLLGLAALGLVATPFTATISADHWWNGSIHWGQTPIVDVTVGDNVTSVWQPYLDGAIDDWNNPVEGIDGVMQLNLTLGTTNPKNCKPAAGRVEVCNARYGATGWIGVAQAWLANHDNHIHITQATVKFNDTYFDTPTYDTPEWRASVACHEIGHTLGLGHRDEDFYNDPIGSCLDYSIEPSTNPDAHDFEQLHWIYAVFFDPGVPHPAGTSGGGGGGGGGRGRGAAQATPGEASTFGRLVADDARESVFEAELGPGQRVVTWVLWAN